MSPEYTTGYYQNRNANIPIILALTLGIFPYINVEQPYGTNMVCLRNTNEVDDHNRC